MSRTLHEPQERAFGDERRAPEVWTDPSAAFTSQRKAELESQGLPPRYAGVILGSGLLMLGSAASVPLGPAANTAAREGLALLTSAAGMILLVAACLPFTAPVVWLRRYARVRAFAVADALVLTLGSLVTFAGGVHTLAQEQPSRAYVTDIVSLTATDADLVLAGRNPYTSDDAFRQALAHYPFALASPMRGRVFGTGYDQPLPLRIAAVQQRYAASPQSVADAFDPCTLHSYPALSFLIYVPLLRAGGTNILLLHFIVYWCLFAWLIWLTPVGWRHWGALVALAAMPTIGASLLVSDEVIVVALILTAWHFRDRPWLSPILLGLACSYKQYAWFFVPFFALQLVQQFGWRETVRRGAIALGAFLLPNLPFIIASPGPWFTSLWLPLSEPLFGMGIGVITLSIGHMLPYAPPVFYVLLELSVMGVLLWAAARWPERVGDGALVLALVPLFFAFRSLADYFAFAPWLALYAASRLYPRTAPYGASRLGRVRVDALRRLWRPRDGARPRGEPVPA